MGNATLNEVSALAGVSRSTASLVLRGSSRISEATAVRVRAAMKELGYVYNRQAANMRQSQSMTIGLVATDIRNPYFAELTMTIEEAVHNAGYTLFVGYSRDIVERQRELLEAMIQRQVDGVFLLPAPGSPTDTAASCVHTQTPVVQLARHFTDQLDYVGADNVAAGELLARHVVSLGSASAALVGGPEPSSARVERIEGLERGFKNSATRFDASESVPTLNNADDGARGLAQFLDRGALPETIIAYSDAVAFGIYAELRNRHLEPGRDVSVGSFDDVPFATLQVPPLTSVATHADAVGREASKLLISRIENPEQPARRQLIDPTLMVRGSTALWRPRVIGH